MLEADVMCSLPVQQINNAACSIPVHAEE